VRAILSMWPAGPIKNWQRCSLVCEITSLKAAAALETTLLAGTKSLTIDVDRTTVLRSPKGNLTWLPPVAPMMEHRGIKYEILQTADPSIIIWTVYLPQNGTKIGISLSKEEANFSAVRAIEAVAMNPKMDQ
jgi:hypothetical protein